MPLDLLDPPDVMTDTPSHDITVIVEDDRPLAEHYAELITRHGIATCIFTEETGLLDHLRTLTRAGRKVAIWLDVGLPSGRQAGIRLSREIRETIGNHVSIVIYTSQENSSVRQEALNAGVDEYFVKSLDNRDLVVQHLLLGLGKSVVVASSPVAIVNIDPERKQVCIRHETDGGLVLDAVVDWHLIPAQARVPGGSVVCEVSRKRDAEGLLVTETRCKLVDPADEERAMLDLFDEEAEEQPWDTPRK